jgi:1-acyl-sn-glycerol-3-phosphate acyltransferase
MIRRMKAQGAGKAQQRFRRVARPVSNQLWRFHLEGFERLPADGPAILAPNHVSFLDSAFLMLQVPRNISFVGKAEYMDSWKTKYFFPMMGMIPIDRAGGDRSRDGYLYKGRTGAARLAMKVGCPIFPVGVVGTREIQPPDAKLPKIRRDCTIKIGRPINVSRYANRGEDHLVLRQITDELMFEIRELTGQEYRNVYAGKTAETEPTVTAKVGTVADDRQLVLPEALSAVAGGGR